MYCLENIKWKLRGLMIAMHHHTEIWSSYIYIYAFRKYCVHPLKTKWTETLFEFNNTTHLWYSFFYYELVWYFSLWYFIGRFLPPLFSAESDRAINWPRRFIHNLTSPETFGMHSWGIAQKKCFSFTFVKWRGDLVAWLWGNWR